MITADSSVLVRYLVGSPRTQARLATRLMEGEERIGMPVVALVETAHVLRTQYGMASEAVITLLIELLQRRNVVLLGLRTDVAIGFLLRARSMPGRPIPDALIVATAVEADALPVASFDRELHRYGVATREP